MFSVKLFWIYVLFSFFNLWVLVDAFSNSDEELDKLYMYYDVQSHENYHLLRSPGECRPIEAISSNKIMGGTDVQLGEFPWMAVLLMKDYPCLPPEQHCGGSIISSKYVLTAAHCFTDDLELANLIVRVGEYDLDKVEDCQGYKCSYATDYEPESLIIHPDYENVTLRNDIGLVRVKGEIIFNEFVYPACLPTSFNMVDENLVGKYVTVAGWGYLAEKPEEVNSHILQKVKMPVVNSSLCSKVFDEIHDKFYDIPPLVESQLCAGGSERGQSMKDACGGDSGGPLVYPSPLDGEDYYVQIGIVSSGPYCYPGSKEQTFGVYTKVESYLLWILNNISE